jgi:regulatory protein
MPDADPASVARAICLRLLTAAPRTRVQLAQALARRRVPAGTAETVLDRLEEVGLVDDAAYAEAWVRTRSVGRGLAGAALVRELRTRGVDPAVVSAAVEQLGPDQEAATALALVQRRLPTMRRLPYPVRVRRLVAMLARKGYPEGLAHRVVRDALRADPCVAGLDDDPVNDA